jgi:adiponectin receptor
MTFYIFFVGIGVLPTLHTWFLLPASVAQAHVFGSLLMIALYAAGVTIYLTKVPERWFPGRFDVFLHSHQLWHLFSLVAALVHFTNCAAMYVQWETMERHC